MENLKQKVLDFVKNDRQSTQEYEEGNSSDTTLSFGTRENGNVGDEEYSEEDLDATEALEKRLN